MSEPSIAELEKQIRLLRRKLERSEEHRVFAEDLVEQSRQLHERLRSEVEAAHREVKRRSALDRVRAEIASMRATADLEHVTPLIWRELTTLGVPFFRCGVLIIDSDAGKSHLYLSTPAGKALASIEFRFEDAPIIAEAVACWRRGEVYREEWDAAEMLAWTDFLRKQGKLADTAEYLDSDSPPDTLALHFVPFRQGMLYVGGKEPLTEELLATVRTLAEAFSEAYARYEDFQRLEAKNLEIEAALTELRAAQQQLVHAEKMASLGALTAGIAHEIKNPLNFVNNFAALSKELAQDLRSEIDELRRGASFGDELLASIEAILDDLEVSTAKIEEHGKRADSIVRSMMLHARGGSREREMVDINALVSEYVDLAYHGKRARTPEFNVEIVRDLDDGTGALEVVPQDLGRVLINLIGNAFDAVQAQAAPRVTISTRRCGSHVELRVADNGPGIPQPICDRIFEPFFTTKPTGSGTGLGLSISYDIVTQGHGGILSVESEEGRGATFIVRLPTT